MIESIGGNGRRYVLAIIGSKPTTPVAVGAIRKSFRGEMFEITGGKPPQHEGSTGHVYARRVGAPSDEGARQFYAGVLDLEWKMLP